MPSGGSPPGVRPSLPDTYNRYLQSRLGRGLRRKKVCRNLDTQGVLALSQSAGNHGSFQGSSVLPSASPSRSPSCSDGQHNHHLVSEQDGRDEIPLARPVSSGDHSLVSQQTLHALSHPSSRGGQCRSRQIVPSSIDPPDEAGEACVCGSPPVDLFATSDNAKLPVFHSRSAEPSVCRGDALQADWSKDLLYLFPPIPLLHLALHKIRREEAEVIAILPWWPRRGWFPLVLSLLVDLPVLLPVRSSLIRNPQGLPHPDLKTLRLAAWRLSEKLSKQQEFLRQLRTLSALVRDNLREICMTPSGGFFVAGVTKTMPIPFTQLLIR